MTAPLRLLLIEDSAADAALLLRKLRHAGYDVSCERVDTAATTQAALDRRPWDLIIADYSMPSFGAGAALALLKQRHSDLPLIIVSGTISEEAAVECMKQGAADYLLKDRLGRIGDAVQRALADQRLRTERQHADHQIRFQARLLDAVEQAVIATNLEGTITFWNQFAERLFANPAAAMLGRSLLEVALDLSSPALAAEIMVSLGTGASWSGEYCVQRQDGTAFPVSATGSPIYDERGTLSGMVAVAVDITERKRSEQAVEQARAAAVELALLRSELVATVSHELRTPLTAILGFSELLLRRWPQLNDAKRVEQITRIVSAAHRQSRLVDDLLLLSQLDNNVPETDCRPVLIAPLAQRAAEEVQQNYPGQRIDLAGAADLTAFADPDRTLQILSNLVDNASKYSPESSPIVVSWREDGGCAVVRVRDHGTGVPEQNHGQLFTRFGRVPGSRIRAGHVGTGLGLYLSRHLARAMGGDVDLEATSPQGSIFRVTLPARNGSQD